MSNPREAPKEFFRDSDYHEVNDSRMDRIMSAPPQDTKSTKEWSSSSIGAFVLTKDDGTPLEVDSTDSENSSSFSKEIETPKNAKDLESILSGLSLKTSSVQELEMEIEDQGYSQSKSSDDTSSKEKLVESPISKKSRNSEEVSVPSPIVEEISTSSNWDYQNESSDEESLSDFVKFMQIERLCREFPNKEIDWADHAEKIKVKVYDILKIKDRSEIDVKFVFSKVNESSVAEKIDALKSKTSSSLEKIRFHFNRVADSNKISVLQAILKVKVDKIDEMREIAAFVFEKIITEPLYFNNYVWMVSELKKSGWKCEEEKSMTDVSQTCFFGTILTLADKKIKSKHTWGTPEDPSTMKCADREELESKIEQSECSRNIRKNQSFGAIDYFVSLYCNNVIGFANINSIIKSLVSVSSYENFELLCHIFKPLSQKLLATGREQQCNIIIDYLKKNYKSYDLRLEFLFESTLESFNLKTSPKQAFASTNTFAKFAEEEESQTKAVKKPESEIIQDYISDVKKAMDLTSDPDDILDIGEKVYKEMDKFNNTLFLQIYFTEMIINSKTYEKFLNVFLEKLAPKAINLRESLNVLKNDLIILSLDFPISSKKYSELLIHLRIGNFINAEAFETLKSGEFLKKGSDLLKKMKDSKDDRLKLVLSEDDIKKI